MPGTRNSFILCTASLLLTLTACSNTKQTWRDWMKEKDRSAMGIAGSTAPPAELPANTNTLVFAPGYQAGDGARVSPGWDLKMRNPDFPRTHIALVQIDLSSPTNGLRLTWTGPNAADGPAGPWRFTPGRGAENVDCDDADTSNTFGSLCTPKGVFPVAGFADHLQQTPICWYCTWVVHAPRFVAIHSHPDLPSAPASAGCIRVPYEAAKLIHNNSIAGVTVVSIGGTWQRAPKKEPWTGGLSSSGAVWRSPHESR